MKLIRAFSEYIRKRNQKTFIYCPKCNTEMISNGYYISDHDGIVKYRCSVCGNVSFWDFCFPAPYLRTCADCKHLRYFNDGSTVCFENCYPDTQNLFEVKGKK